MILCLCEGTSDRQLREAVRRGCTTVRDLIRETRAGSHCGQCACDLKRLVAESTTEAEADSDRTSGTLVIAK